MGVVQLWPADDYDDDEDEDDSKCSAVLCLI